MRIAKAADMSAAKAATNAAAAEAAAHVAATTTATRGRAGREAHGKNGGRSKDNHGFS
jgi:hypothetical protein